MTFTQMLDEIGYPYSEAEFRSEAKPPYMVWERDVQTIMANSVVVYIADEYTLYLAHHKNDDETEQQVESVLDAHKIAYSKERNWIGGAQRKWLVAYSFEGREDW